MQFTAAKKKTDYELVTFGSLHKGSNGPLMVSTVPPADW